MVLSETVVTPEMVREFSVFSERPEGKGLLEACSESPVVFSRHMLGLELYTWQKLVALDVMRAVNNPSLPREFVILTSRQIGKTTLAAVLALWVAVFNKLPSDVGVNSDAGIISASDRQAKLVLKEIRNLIRLGDAYCREHYSRSPDDVMAKGLFSSLIDESDDNNKEVISFKPQEWVVNSKGLRVPKLGDFLLRGSVIGTKLKSYAPTATVLGQKFAYLHEDECGLVDKFTDEVHYDYLKPTGNARNAIRLYTSTPWVPSGFFYDLVDVDDKREGHDYFRYLFTIDAIKHENPEQYATVMRDIERMKAEGRFDEVRRAYYCEFVQGQTSFFDPVDVDEAFDESLVMVDESDLPVDIGIDFGGQTTSRSVITVTALIDGVITRLYHKVYGVKEDDGLMSDLELLMKRFPNWQRIIPDDCPQGDYLIRQMVNNGWNVQPMKFRTWKVKKYTAFRSKLSKGLIKSYTDNDLKEEMKGLEVTQGVTNTIIRARKGLTDDLIDSFVMSAFFYLDDEDNWGVYDPSKFIKKSKGVLSNVRKGFVSKVS